MSNEVLVTCATGKVGLQTCKALKAEGFEVYGTTRTALSGKKLTAIGVTPVVCDYATDLKKGLDECGAKKLFFITDFFLAAGKNADREFEQGKQQVDAAKAAGVEHTVFMSVDTCEEFPPECTHILAKPRVEAYLKESGLQYSIVGASCFFENLDDAANWNPLTKGSLKFLMMEKLKWCSTYDLGRAASVMYKNPTEWNGKKMGVVSFHGSLDEVADALEKITGFPVKRGLAMPLFARKLFLKDLDYMCNFFRDSGLKSTPEDLAKHIPDALGPEAWFRQYNKYANGEAIVGNTTPPAGRCTIS